MTLNFIVHDSSSNPTRFFFWRIYNAKISRKSYECRTNFVRQSRDSLEKTCENLATIWRGNKLKRHSYECRETLSQMSRDCRTNENETATLRLCLFLYSLTLCLRYKHNFHVAVSSNGHLCDKFTNFGLILKYISRLSRDSS